MPERTRKGTVAGPPAQGSLVVNEHVTNRPAETSTRLTERPASDTRITTAPPEKWPRTLAKRILGAVAVLAALWAFGVSLGWLPRWEEDGPLDPDAVEPIDLPALLARAERAAAGQPAW